MSTFSGTIHTTVSGMGSDALLPAINTRSQAFESSSILMPFPPSPLVLISNLDLIFSLFDGF